MLEKLKKYIKDKLYGWLLFNSFLLYLSLREMNKELKNINESLEESFKYIHTEESLARFHSRAKNINERVNRSLARILETKSMKYKFIVKEYKKLFQWNEKLKEKVTTFEMMMGKFQEGQGLIYLDELKKIEDLSPEGKKIN